MGREVGSWMRDVWQDAREFRHCRKASSGRDARRWDDHTCTLASRSVYTDGTHGVGAGNGVKGGDHFFREVSYCSHYPRFDTERDVPDVETSNWRAVCGKTASTVRREGRCKSLPYPYQGPHHAAPGLLRRFAPRNDDSDRSDAALVCIR